MKVLIASVALVLLAVAEASYLPYGGGVVASYDSPAWPVTSSVTAYPSYGLYGKSVLPLATAKYAAYPAVYNSYHPVASKVVAYSAPATVYGGATKVLGYGAGYGFGAGYGYGAGFGYGAGYGKALPSKYYW